jgi:DNA-binding phage protein
MTTKRKAASNQQKFQSSGRGRVRDRALGVQLGITLERAVTMLLAGEMATARSLIREAINASVGYAAVSRCTGTPEKSLVRMFGPKGNPRAENLAAVLAALQRLGQFRLLVKTVRRVGYRPAKRKGRRVRS